MGKGPCSRERRAAKLNLDEVRQQCPCHASCFLRGIPACVLQRVREDGDETGIVRRRCGAVRAYLFAGKEDSLRRPSAAVRLDPAPTPAIQCASPKANLFRPQGRVRHLQHDAAHVFVSEEIVGSSIVLSGGYVDDEDMGDVIIYTGEGGRDPNSGQQIADQQLVSGNMALAENHLSGIPFRVHRGKAHVSDMPEGFRYRYDGPTALRDTGRNLDETASKFGGFVSRRPWCRMTQRHQRIWHNANQRIERRPTGTRFQIDVRP